MAIPVILKGETPKPIPLALKEGYDYSGCCLHVEFCGLQDTFINLEAGGRVDLRYTAEQTAVLPLGTSKVMLSLENANGEVRFMPWAKIKVTDSPADLYDGVITIDPATLDVDDLTAKDSLGAVKTKLQTVISFLRALKVIAIAALPFVACADVAPLYTTPNDMPGDAPLMTNAQEYVDAKVASIPEPDFSTSNDALVATIEATAPAPGDYATVSNKAMTALQSFTEADPTVPTWAKSATQPLPPDYANVSNLAVDAVHKRGAETIYGEKTFNDGVRLYEVGGSGNITTLFDYAIIHNDNYIRYPEADGTLALESTVAAAALAATNYTDSATNALAQSSAAAFMPASFTESDPTISSWAKAASKPTYTADEVGAVSSNKIEEVRTDNAQTRQIVTTWENFLDGSNVVFSITNYLSGSYNLDAAKLRILELREGEYHEVYNSRDEILLHIENFTTNDFRVATNQLVGAVNEAIGGKADRDWGKYTSAGGDAPANTVYMTAPNTVFAGGLEYERVAVGEGTICVLTTRGAPVWTQGDEGTFKFQDDGGTNYFGFAKTDSYTIGANTDGITVQGGMVTMNYNITMSGRPCVWYKSSLSSGAWEQLNLPDGSPVAGASHAVTWEANPDPGTQVCYINVGNAPSGFFRATVEVTGEAKFMTNMPADMSGGIVCPNTATGVSGVIKPTFNGTSVIWTWSAK